MSCFRKILTARAGLGIDPPPEIAETATWLHAVLLLADATAFGADESQSVPNEAARRLHVAGVSPAVAEHVRKYALNLGL